MLDSYNAGLRSISKLDLSGATDKLNRIIIVPDAAQAKIILWQIILSE
jgi:hypothetical protein